MKKFFVCLLDITLSILVISMFWFVNQWIISSIMVIVMLFVGEHYLVARKCYLEDK